MSERGPLFTQKHYEHLMCAIQSAAEQSLADRGVTMQELEGAAEFLCRAFKKDNPKFKREKFLACLRRAP